MKSKHFIISVIVLAGIALFNSACGGKKAGKDVHAHDHEGEHIFACPMHPEVRGKEGDKCPKCGMKLEHMDELTVNNESYIMKLEMNPSEPTAGSNTLISLTPKKSSDENVEVPLDIEHEKKIHLIITSEDLSFFDHQHPEYNKSGSYDLSYAFPFGGKFLLFADYKPSGATHTTDQLQVSVKGDTPIKTIFTSEKLDSKTGDFEIILKPLNNKIATGGTAHIEAVIKLNGKEMDANTLDNYLGAKAHVVVIGLEDKNYLHVHPEVTNGRLDLHTSFEKTGFYRAWVQFQYEGTIYTADFVLKVVQGENIQHDNHKSEDHVH